ncbi:D-alanyl-D-alanine carboxypeptidase [Streptomyces sp. JW3]|uniref:D-alanyl-D-alanine carboxypeptidase n=1 Tax=Streptomyces sp. JW3 TaxID=3456955 RepID=UPI003FA4CBB9
MEEASVAGESPDRSKQRESSAERTSGSGGPVPGARTEDGTEEARDPRLAVTREAAETRRAAGQGSGPGGGADTATRVRPAPADAADSDAEGAEDPEDTGSGTEGDGRLREAVAAWVRSADADEEPTDADAGPDDAAESADEDVTEGTEGPQKDDEAPRGPADAVDDPGAGSGASEGAQGRAEGSAGAGSGDDTATDSETDDDTESESESKSESGNDAESGDADAAGGDDTAASSPAKDEDQPKKPDADTDEDADDVPQSPDQPTAVFKAPRPAAPPVDQPTTMLKLGGKQDEKGEKDKAGEALAERTSRFVALKPLDDPAPKPVPKPAPAAEGFERTRQQPLPPKPPLDLLAELTNTPPPPETPLRTTWRRVKIWTPLVLLLVIVFAVVQAVRPLPTPTLQLTAQQTVSFEGDKPSVPWPTQGQAAMDVNGIGSFGTSGDQKPVPIASIAKVMTVYLILRDHPLKTGDKGPKITVDAAAQKHYETGKAASESVVKVTEGQKITEYEALQAVMLPSANNVAKLLARWDTGSSSEDEFVAKMNKTAKELGMTNTTYTDPSGLDKTTVSTAADLVKLGRAAMENPVFKEISKQPSYVDLNGETQTNFFGLVPTVAIGIKTGTTTAAGGNILFAAEKNVGGKTQTIIGAALGQYGQNGTANIDEVTSVVRGLIESGQDALTAKTIVKKGDVVGQVDDGLGGTTPVVATKDVSAVGWSGLTVKLELDEPSDGSVPHTAQAGTKVGTLTVGDGSSAETIEVPVALKDDLAEPALTAKLTRIG